MSKQDYLTEDNINPIDQKFVCISFFNKKNIKQIVDNNNEHLNEEQKEQYSTENNILALKVRGCFKSYEDASAHAKKLQSIDEYHNVYVAECNKWCPFIIEDDDKLVESSEYANDELNSMMKTYMENQEKAKLFHEYRKNDLIKKNIEDNIKLKKDNFQESETLLETTTDKEEKKKIKNSLSTIKEQIEKLETRQKELEEQEKSLKETLQLR
jgi:hypothetical protein